MDACVGEQLLDNRGSIEGETSPGFERIRYVTSKDAVIEFDEVWEIYLSLL